MTKKSGLGRGLDSLIPNKAARTLPKTSPVISDTAGEKVLQISIDRVHADPDQPRKDFSQSGLEDLADSIKSHGIIQPLIVTEDSDGYQIIAGERRFRASQMLNLKTIPVIVRKAERHQKLEMALIENIQRENLNPIEEAVAYQRLLNEFNIKHEDLAKRIGKSRPVITNSLRLLSLPEEIQKALIDGKISFTVARFIVGLPKDEQMKYFKKALADKLSVTALQEHTRKDNVAVKTYKKRSKDPNLIALEEDLQDILGTMVTVSKSGESGKIQVSFYSDEELYNIVEKFKKING